jgi:hypothetical protein
MVSPCALIAASVVGQVRIASLADKLGALERARSDESSDLGTGGLIAAARRFAGATKTAPFVSVFGGGWAWPAVIDFESKSVEAGLTVAQVHEVKDFSHGRFISLLANTAIPALFMGVPAVLPYERALLHSLRKGRIVIEVVPEGEGIVGGLELLAMMQYVIEICGEECGRDISRPDKIPESGLRLYRWRDEAVGARLRAERGLLFDTE